MTKITPILTEKSLKEAKGGVFSFWLASSLTKGGIKKLVEQLFEVKVDKVRTINYKKEVKKNYRGRKVSKSARKKALVTLKEGKTIDLFKTEK